MKLLKYCLFIFLPVMFILGFIPELSAKSHRNHHSRKTTRTSFSFNLNLDARPARSVGYTVVQQPTTAYVVQQPTTYIVQSPGYYEQVTVVQPYVNPINPVIVQRPAPSLYLFPSFSFWGY